MMTRTRRAILGWTATLLAGALGANAYAADAPKWVEGRHYTVLQPAQASRAAAGKVEVTEVFSYGCPACNQFQASIDKIKAGLPANAQLTYVPAAWNPSESWPLFQRAYLTAQSLGVADKNHVAMFAAIWGSNGVLAVADLKTGRLKPRQPTIEDVARFYAKQGGVTEAQFLQTAKSFAVDTRIRQSDALIKGYKVASTPSLVVAGKYRIEMSAIAGGTADFIQLIRYLVEKESGGR
jgi:protein dithiol oxidoreductase (disulfide-forming)